MKAFLDNPKQTRRWSIIIAVVVAVLFLVFKAGFSASLFWLALLAFMLIMPFIKHKSADEHRLQEFGKGTFILTIVLGLFVLFFGPSDGGSSWSSPEYSSPSGGGGSSDGSAHEGQIADLQNQIQSKSEEVEQLYSAYSQALAQADGNVMVAQRMYPDICSQFRDRVNEYTSLCHKAADICAKNGDQSQATYFRQLAIQMDRSVAELEGRP